MLDSDGYGGDQMGLDLGWTNLSGYDGAVQGSPFGIGMTDSDFPSIEPTTSGGYAAVQGAGNAIFFAASGGRLYAGILQHRHLGVGRIKRLRGHAI